MLRSGSFPPFVSVLYEYIVNTWRLNCYGLSNHRAEMGKKVYASGEAIIESLKFRLFMK